MPHESFDRTRYPSMTVAQFEALSSEQQADYNRWLLALWQDNYERELDKDFVFDHLPYREELSR